MSMSSGAAIGGTAAQLQESVRFPLAGAREADLRPPRARRVPAESVDRDRRAAARPHVLVTWTAEPATEPLVRALPDDVRITVLDLTRHISGAVRPASPLDVALLRPSLVGVGLQRLLRDPAFGLPEPVFVVDDAWSPERFLLESLGVGYIVAWADLARWLPAVLPRLCALAVARRAAAQAAADRPPSPDLLLPTLRLDGLTLHAAETRFREAYLRLALVEQGSRRRAAERAGIPYRSFCGMLRKLGI